MTAHLPAEHRTTPGGQPRARALGLPFGGRPGRWNAITDVPGVEVGYVTRIEGSHIRTGSPPSTPAARMARRTRWQPASTRRTATAR